jgi:glyoxylase-like metal-dependent hydrolase (beta-lactamase superfamily II)
MDGVSRGSLRARLASHCLLVETATSLVLVDTGYGLRDVERPRSRINPLFLSLMKPELTPEMTAFRQIQRLGFDPRDVRHIVLSHLDFDHAGGLDDFPAATVHLFSTELDSALARRTVLDRMRYRPQQWGTRAGWLAHAPDQGEDWLGFSGARALPLGDPDLLLIPLVGHTLGHAGVAIRQATGWLFYAADAYFYHAEMNEDAPYCTPGLRLYQRMMEKDRGLRLLNQRRLRELRRNHREVTLFCAHDLQEFEALSAGSPPLSTEAPIGTSTSITAEST